MAEEVEYNLKGRQPAHKGRSAFNNTKLYTVHLRDQWTIEESTDVIELAPGARLAGLKVTGDNGGGHLASITFIGQDDYLYEYKPQAVNLNDHVGSVNLDNRLSHRHGVVTPHHAHHGPVAVPVAPPATLDGTGDLDHQAANITAGALHLTDEDLALLDRAHHTAG
ncbi:hypothetical protein ACFXD5_23690 [Streptomyces sp. NPDC059385]|uniref:hypothetical protein n=1 Tax=Streptomyces sp. NPDC059385 TaxID=3346817 RepID=UPI00368C7DCF